LRFFTVVGPRQRPDLAVHRFVKAILNNQTVQLRGDLSSSRDYTSVYDTIEGIIGSINRIMVIDTPEYQIYNLGNSYPVRLDEMLRVIEEILGKKSKVEFVEHMPGDVNSTYAEISRAEADLHYKPKRSFKEAVESFVDWM
jgi:UDP-glucuronate 4-epimerase